MRLPSFVALVLLACAAGSSKAIPAPVQTERDGAAFALVRPARLLESTALSRVRTPQVGRVRVRCSAQTQEYSTRRAMLAASAVMGAQAVLGVGGVSASTREFKLDGETFVEVEFKPDAPLGLDLQETQAVTATLPRVAIKGVRAGVGPEKGGMSVWKTNRECRLHQERSKRSDQAVSSLRTRPRTKANTHAHVTGSQAEIEGLTATLILVEIQVYVRDQGLGLWV